MIVDRVIPLTSSILHRHSIGRSTRHLTSAVMHRSVHSNLKIPLNGGWYDRGHQPRVKWILVYPEDRDQKQPSASVASIPPQLELSSSMEKVENTIHHLHVHVFVRRFAVFTSKLRESTDLKVVLPRTKASPQSESMGPSRLVSEQRRLASRT